MLTLWRKFCSSSQRRLASCSWAWGGTSIWNLSRVLLITMVIPYCVCALCADGGFLVEIHLQTVNCENLAEHRMTHLHRVNYDTAKTCGTCRHTDFSHLCNKEKQVSVMKDRKRLTWVSIRKCAACTKHKGSNIPASKVNTILPIRDLFPTPPHPPGLPLQPPPISLIMHTTPPH